MYMEINLRPYIYYIEVSSSATESTIANYKTRDPCSKHCKRIVYFSTFRLPFKDFGNPKIFPVRAFGNPEIRKREPGKTGNIYFRNKFIDDNFFGTIYIFIILLLYIYIYIYSYPWRYTDLY